MHHQPMYRPLHQRHLRHLPRQRRLVPALAVVALVCGLLVLMAWLQDGDNLQDAEAAGYERGYTEAMREAGKVARDAYLQGWADRGQQP